MTEMLSALALAEAVRAGRLTPADIADRCADTIEAQEPDIRAFATVDTAALREKARNPDLAAMPLAGLPVGVKDIIDTVDFDTARGSPIYAGHRPASDASVVSMVKRAGGIIAGKTQTTEFAFLTPAETRNPRRPSHTPGGSSAGSAAAVAAGMLPIALGTQTAGSVMRPASYCGITGYKPSFKLVPTIGVKAFSWSLDTVGLFTAHVSDAAFAASAITGRDLSLDHKVEAPRLAIVQPSWSHEASPDAHRVLEAAARAAGLKGARVVALELPPEVEAAQMAQGIVQSYEAALAFAYEWDNHREKLSPMLQDYFRDALAVTPDQYDAARRTSRRARNALADALNGFDAALTFSATGEAPEGHGSTGSSVFHRLWTLMGAPCINVPGLEGSTGMPIGVQVVGRFGRDKGALNVARFIERAITAT